MEEEAFALAPDRVHTQHVIIEQKKLHPEQRSFEGDCEEGMRAGLEEREKREDTAELELKTLQLML